MSVGPKARRRSWNVVASASAVALLAGVSVLIGAAPADAATLGFDSSPGTGAPPSTLGGYTMTPFGADPQTLDVDVSSVASPLGSSISFSPNLFHTVIDDEWATWSNGYEGDVYSTEDDSATITLPAGTTAFSFYVEPEQFGDFAVTASALASDESSLSPSSIDVSGDGGAQYFGFYTDGSVTLSSITVSLSYVADGFAIGEFGIASGGSAQGPITILTRNGTFGTPLRLQVYGVSGGLPQYMVTDPGTAGCSVSDLTELVTTHAGSCVVTASYNGVSSPPTLITFGPADQAPLALTSTSGIYGTPIALKTNGGSDGGAVTYSVTDPGTAGCAASGATLTSTSAGICTVTATMAGDSDYLPVSSPPTTVTFGPTDQAPLTITTTTGTYGRALSLATSGGSDHGAVSYVLSDPGSAGCLLSGATLTATSAGTCGVSATMAGDTDYLAVSSLPTTITFSPEATTTSLQLSRSVVRFGHEQLERLTVVVAAASGTPVGSVVISGTSCVITLVNGRGSCTLGTKALAVGAHHLTALYFGSSNFSGSSSRTRTVVVKF